MAMAHGHEAHEETRINAVEASAELFGTPVGVSWSVRILFLFCKFHYETSV
jgi:hypothetical protein